MPFVRRSRFPGAHRRSTLAFAFIGLAFIGLAWGGLAGPGARADNAAPPALRHGVNLSNWFAEAQRQPLVPHDFQSLKQAGFDHVRIPINPELLGFSLAEAAEGRVLFDFSALDEAVNQSRDAGLTVILDIHPTEGLMSMAELDPRAETSFVALWKVMADHYKSFPPSAVAFEIINEPHYANDLARYHAMIVDVVGAIRKITPDHIVIVDMPKGAAIEGFDGFAGLGDDKVYYAFHFYQPFLFTHQGLRTAGQGEALRYFRSLPYPSSAVQPRVNYAPVAPDVLEAKKELTDYVVVGWNASRLAQRLKPVADWAAANHAHVICTEFGVVRNYANPVSRYRWIADARKALEAKGIGWTLWDYADSFGIVTLSGETIVEPVDGTVHLADPSQGSRDIEPDAVKALFQN
jgi:endoglucanase